MASLTAVALACVAAPVMGQDNRDQVVERIQAHMAVITHDSMEGRRAATRGARRAVTYLAGQFAALGIQSAGTDGYLQAVPLVRVQTRRGQRLQLRDGFPPDSLTPDRLVEGHNVIGRIPGGDSARRHEVVVIGAHFDHVGIGRPVGDDSIYNGADDDASGVVAVLEAARALAEGPPPARTVVFILATAEEMGVLGMRHFVAHPTVDLDDVVANLQVEMIGRPDSAAGGTGQVWLTGYERSTMGEMFRASGVSVVPDPRPEQRFFVRSDNIVFARAGIPAHTISSFGLHEDYHRPSDEVGRIDFGHMAAAVQTTIRAVRVLADGDRPEWHEGGRP